MAQTDKCRELVDKLPRDNDARWNTARKGGPVSCFADTRSKVLADTETWVLSDDPNTHPPSG